jgi:Ni/Co efflux regulator RcnB
MMHQVVRIGCGVLALAALSACVVVPDRGPPPAYGRVEYRAAPPPPPPQARVEIGFHDRQREMAREYYREHRRYRDRDDDDRRCPPGLAKKGNGCMPPGQARKWRRGEPLPRDVVYQPVPRDLEVRIGPPPRGYRYVDVAGDILMIAVGTAVVVDAIQDLNR